METFTGDSGATWRYETFTALGDAGGGNVFRGAADDGSPVAVRKLRLRQDGYSGPQLRERQGQVAAILAGLPARHVLPTLDVGAVGADLLIVRPLARRSLATAIADRSLDWDARFDVLRQIVEGLVELAGASVVHRNLTPTNVVEHDGRWQVTDFSPECCTHAPNGANRAPANGTAAYMAPELWANQAPTVRSDLYAFGAIAFEVLTGACPFPGPSDDDYRRQHREEPPRLLEGFPSAVERVVARLLAKEPTKRPRDARMLQQAFRRPVATTMSAPGARAYWRALMENVVALIEDAVLLLEQSPSRARSLLILAQEETGKAQRLYELAHDAWTSDMPTVELPGPFTEMETRHHNKIVASLRYGDELDAFWGDYSGTEVQADMSLEEFFAHTTEVWAGHERSAKTINLDKQAGFYVDRKGEKVTTPRGVDVGDLVADIMRTAGVAEMLFITDHSRMKIDTPERYDSTHDLQCRLLPFSHPDDYFAMEDAPDPNGPDPGHS